MRVIEPKKYSPTNKTAPKKSNKNIVLVVLLIAVGVVAGSYTYFSRNTKANPDVAGQQVDDASQEDIAQEEPAAEQGGEFRVFKGNEFRLLYDNLLQPNLDRVDIPPVITGNDIADARIRKIAEARGYKLRSSPLGELPSVDGYPVQEPLIAAWNDMQAAAASDGYDMSIVSAYRSIDAQRQLFTTRLSALGVSQQEVIDGDADEAINTILVTTSIPGYSKHHTGYTLDLTCAGYVFEQFKQSPCYGWISANNYENAKRFGFIPSYPSDADLQGPDPEAWEYVWVGLDLLRNE